MSFMKKSLIIIFLVSVLFTLGCTYFTAEDMLDETNASDTDGVNESTSLEKEDGVADLIDEVVDEENGDEIVDIPELLNNSNTTELVAISGDLNLQNDLELCPHLTKRFDCNRYDIRRCDFKTFVGANDFYPDLISCRDGRKSGENSDHKYCLIQSCRPMQKDNIVYAYGGQSIYAEYAYVVENVGDSIMTHYTLEKCGEEHAEFETHFDCVVYKSELEMFK